MSAVNSAKSNSSTKRVASTPAPAAKQVVHAVSTGATTQKENSKVAFLLIAFVVTVISGLFGVYYYLNKEPDAASKITLDAPGLYMDIPEVRTNLGKFGSIQTKLSAEISYDKEDMTAKEAQDVVKAHMPVISDAVLGVLTTLTPSEVKEGGPAGVAFKIKKQINQNMKDYRTGTKVKDILVQEFVYVI